MFHMSNDSHRFRTQEELEAHEYILDANIFRPSPGSQEAPGA